MAAELGSAGVRVNCLRPGGMLETRTIQETLTDIFSVFPDVVRGRMFGFPAFYTAGKLFACVYGEGVGLKLPPELVSILENRPGILPFQPYGKPRMHAWIILWHECAEDYRDDRRLFIASIAFVSQAEKTQNVSDGRDT
jgi:hypothetical protein